MDVLITISSPFINIYYNRVEVRVRHELERTGRMG